MFGAPGKQQAEAPLPCQSRILWSSPSKAEDQAHNAFSLDKLVHPQVK